MQKRRIPYGWGVPLGCAAAMLCGQTEGAMLLLCAWLTAGFLTLCAPDALRRASARAMNDERLGRMLRSAAVMTLPAMGCIAAAAATGWEEPCIMMLGAGLLLTWTNAAQSVMEARRDLLSLTLLDILTFIAITAALVAFPEQRDASCLAASAALTVLGVSFGLWPVRKGWKLSGAYFREIPLSLLRNLIWPALALGILWMEGISWTSLRDTLLPLGFALGCGITSALRPMFRLSRAEGNEMCRGIPVFALIVCVGAWVAAGKCPHTKDILTLILPALGCAMCTFGPAQIRAILAGLLLILPGGRSLWTGLGMTSEWFFAGCLAASVAAVLMTLPEWLMALRMRKAQRMRKNAGR